MKTALKKPFSQMGHVSQADRYYAYSRKLLEIAKDRYEELQRSYSSVSKNPYFTAIGTYMRGRSNKPDNIDSFFAFYTSVAVFMPIDFLNSSLEAVKEFLNKINLQNSVITTSVATQHFTPQTSLKLAFEQQEIDATLAYEVEQYIQENIVTAEQIATQNVGGFLPYTSEILDLRETFHKGNATVSLDNIEHIKKRFLETAQIVHCKKTNEYAICADKLESMKSAFAVTSSHDLPSEIPAPTKAILVFRQVAEDHPVIQSPAQDRPRVWEALQPPPPIPSMA